jgi:SNF2 family DNA or RNA helicase
MSNNILDSILQLKPKIVYDWFPFEYINQGFKLHYSSSVKELKILNKQQVTTIVLDDSRRYKVTLICSNIPEIKMECTCMLALCQHRVASILMLFSILHENVFSANYSNDSDLKEKILKHINLNETNKATHTSKEKNSIKKQIHIKQLNSHWGHYFQISYSENDIFIDAYNVNFPKDLKNIYISHGNFIYDTNRLVSFILELPDIYLINLYKGSESYTDFKVDKKDKNKDILNIIKQDNNLVNIDFKVNYSNKNTNYNFFFDLVYLDTKNKLIKIYNKTQARSLFDSFLGRFYVDGEIEKSNTVELEVNDADFLFISSTEHLSSIKNNLFFYHKNKQTKLNIENLKFLLKTNISNNKKHISFEILFKHKEKEYHCFHLNNIYNHYFYGIGGRSLKAKFRQNLLLQMINLMILEESEKQKKKIRKDFLVKMNFLSRSDKKEVNYHIDDFFKVLEEEKQFVKVLNNRFFSFQYKTFDFCKIVAAIIIAFTIELKDFLFEENAAIPFSTYIKNFKDFFQLCQNNNIEIINNTVMEHQSLDIEVDISETENIDWFEINSKVFCHKKKISDDKWLKILADGYIETKNGISIIDSNSLAKLSQLVNITTPSKKNKQEIASIPRLAILDWINLKQKGFNIKLPLEAEKIFTSLAQFKGIPEIKLPNIFLAKLRTYQKQGVDWLAFLYEHKLGAILADDMGLGKTVQTIAFIANILNNSGKKLPILIVVPPTLVFNWKNEFEKFLKNFSAVEYIGMSRKKIDISKETIIITSYETLRRDIHYFQNQKYEIIVFDEAQAIKNIHAKRTSAVRSLQGKFKLCLTGTPIENHLGEYFSIIDLAISGLCENLQTFMNNSKLYLSRIRPFVLRRTKTEILKELPEKIESNIYLNLTDKQKALYVRVVAEIRETVAEAFKYQPQQQAGIIALTALLKLRQICVATQIINPEEKEVSPKFAYLLEKLIELKNEEHSAIIFSQFTSCLSLLSEELDKNNIKHFQMTGKTPMGKRKKLVNDFQNSSEPMFFLISLKTGGVGINLTKASYVIHIDPWWNPAIENQATDRTHRIGQNKTVHVFRLIMKDTVEEKIMLLKQKKQNLFDEIMSGETISQSLSIKKDDFDYLLQ